MAERRVGYCNLSLASVEPTGSHDSFKSHYLTPAENVLETTPLPEQQMMFIEITI